MPRCSPAGAVRKHLYLIGLYHHSVQYSGLRPQDSYRGSGAGTIQDLGWRAASHGNHCQSGMVRHPSSSLTASQAVSIVRNSVAVLTLLHVDPKPRVLHRVWAQLQLSTWAAVIDKPKAHVRQTFTLSRPFDPSYVRDHPSRIMIYPLTLYPPRRHNSRRRSGSCIHLYSCPSQTVILPSHTSIDPDSILDGHRIVSRDDFPVALDKYRFILQLLFSGDPLL